MRDSHPSKDKATILVVEDEDSVRALVSRILGSSGYSILLARNSDEAFQVSDSYLDEIQLLLTDVKMDPFMSGPEVAHCLRLLRPGMKVLYMSGFAPGSEVGREVTEGHASFLPKPFDVQGLLKAVAGILAPAPV